MIATCMSIDEPVHMCVLYRHGWQPLTRSWMFTPTEQLRNCNTLLFSFTQKTWYLRGTIHSIKTSVSTHTHTETYMANAYTHTHTTLVLVLMQVGSWKNIGKVHVFLCLEYIVKCYELEYVLWFVFYLQTQLWGEFTMSWFHGYTRSMEAMWLWLEPYLCTVKFTFLCQQSRLFYICRYMVAGIPNKNTLG